MGSVGPLQLIVVLFYLFIVVFPIWKIISRLGYSGWLSLLSFIPVVNLVFLWVLAFSKWPIENINKMSLPNE
ncbi:MAG: hypothetical protein COA85_04335 [Robiginitomaculum sp.]|nr:MAG: hypothetical protein COA85_04335 [Robiginitomaculum sp.]